MLQRFPSLNAAAGFNVCCAAWEQSYKGNHMSYSLNSLKGGYIGDYIGDHSNGY